MVNVQPAHNHKVPYDFIPKKRNKNLGESTYRYQDGEYLEVAYDGASLCAFVLKKPDGKKYVYVYSSNGENNYFNKEKYSFEIPGNIKSDGVDEDKKSTLVVWEKGVACVLEDGKLFLNGETLQLDGELEEISYDKLSSSLILKLKNPQGKTPIIKLITSENLSKHPLKTPIEKTKTNTKTNIDEILRKIEFFDKNLLDHINSIIEKDLILDGINKNILEKLIDLINKGTLYTILFKKDINPLGLGNKEINKLLGGNLNKIVNELSSYIISNSHISEEEELEKHLTELSEFNRLLEMGVNEIIMNINLFSKYGLKELINKFIIEKFKSYNPQLQGYRLLSNGDKIREILDNGDLFMVLLPEALRLEYAPEELKYKDNKIREFGIYDFLITLKEDLLNIIKLKCIDTILDETNFREKLEVLKILNKKYKELLENIGVGNESEGISEQPTLDL